MAPAYCTDLVAGPGGGPQVRRTRWRRARPRRTLVTVPALDALLDLQCGVVTRAQLVAHGVDAVDVRRRLRRRELTRHTPGVYVTHTGPLTWRQRA